MTFLESHIFGNFSPSKLIHYAHSPKSLSSSFPTSKNPNKNHAFTTNCTRILCRKNHNLHLSPPKIPKQNQTQPQKARNSPQLTTKTEQPFYPQEGGRSSAIDICVSRKPHSSTCVLE